GVRSNALETGMSPAQLSSSAKICLSVGYKSDNMPVAVGSGLILAALGEGAYGELMGHHLSQGFGATTRSDLAFEWYDIALKASDTPGGSVFAPGQPERMQLVRKAAYMMVGKADQAAAEPGPAALPTFAAPAATEEAAVVPAPEVPAIPEPATTESAMAEPAVPAVPVEEAAADTGMAMAPAEPAGAMPAGNVNSLLLAARLPLLLRGTCRTS